MEDFISGLRSDIAKDVMIGYYTPNTYLEVISIPQRSKAMKLRMVKEICIPK